MVALKVGSKSFERNYRERTKALRELVEGLPDRPASSEIHDLRVTARRIQVMRRLLPKGARSSQDSRRYATSLKSVLKSTSELRDLDTLMETLEPYRKVIPDDVFRRLENQRSDAAANAKVASSVLANMPQPDLDADVGGKRLSRELRKDIRRHGRKASSLVSEVVLDESKVAELHALRKEVKKLRYLCELADGPPRELAVLTKWQGYLGSVHDIDVALEHVRGNAIGFQGRAISQLERSRHLGYTKFIGEYRIDVIGLHGKSKVLPGPPMTFT